MGKAAKQKAAAEADTLSTIIGFTEGVLGMSLYGWQDRALAPLELASGPEARRIKVAVVAPNGAGKDERTVAPAALWWPTVHPRGRVVITSKDSKQINEQTVPAIKRHIHKFDGWRSVDSPYFKVTTPQGGSIHCFVTDEASRLEGWHKEDDINGPLLFIVNESKSVSDAQFQAVDRCTWNALMLISSGGAMMGRHYDAFHKLRAGFVCVQVGLADCPHIPKEKIDDIISTYGEDHPFTRSCIYGEFMSQDDMDQYAVPLASLQRCMSNPPNHRPGFKIAAIDFGGGTAETVIAVRDGNKILPLTAWREANKIAQVGRFIHEFVKLDIPADKIWADAADKEMCDLLRDAGWDVNRRNFGSPANDKGIYQSIGAEMWLEGAHGIEKCEWILPDDDILFAQMTTRKRVISRLGKLGIEDKYLMRQPPRSLPSPDRADAVFMAMSLKDYSSYGKQGIDLSAWRGELGRGEHAHTLAEIGANAGY